MHQIYSVYTEDRHHLPALTHAHP